MTEKLRIGIMTSGGDAPGMNAAVRAVVKSAIKGGAEVYGIYNGYVGLQHPENGGVKELGARDVRGIINLGGTILGTARCDDMMQPEGRRRAISTLVNYGIDRLVCIGGDGSLTGADTLRREWEKTVKSLVEAGTVAADALKKHPFLSVIGLPGTIDNDLCGSEITIGADTALHRIVDAVDSIFSTAASHKRTFVVEVMGRHCGYLAVMTGLATGAEWVLIPEDPCRDGWEEKMYAALSKGRRAGKRAAIVIIAEGARDIHGRHISADYVQKFLTGKGEDARVTILGHVQRGGSPSAYDRNLGSLLGHEAVKYALREKAELSVVLVMKGNRPVAIPLMQAVEETHRAQQACISEEDDGALRMRSRSLAEAYALFKIANATELKQTIPNPKRIAIVHCGAPAPGMNMAVRTAARLLIARGHEVVKVVGGLSSFIKCPTVDSANLEFKSELEPELKSHSEQNVVDDDPRFKYMEWMSVSGWACEGGARIGTSHTSFKAADLYDVSSAAKEKKLDAIIVIGGWEAYECVNTLFKERRRANDGAIHGSHLDIPIICIPATIDNNLPGSELSIGADTALNCIIDSVDKIKRSAVANKRAFLVEVMGAECGYLAQMSGLATGAECIYLNEHPKNASEILKDIEKLKDQFSNEGRTVALVINNEKSNYSTSVLKAMFETEGQGDFNVRYATLGHIQQGGDPTSFDRTLAARLADAAVNKLMEIFQEGGNTIGFVGMQPESIKFFDFYDYDRMTERNVYERGGKKACRRPKYEWWLESFIELHNDLA
ncbi:MAG: 6-phosphofructokinase [Candidatus Bruticola sp.]